MLVIWVWSDWFVFNVVFVCLLVVFVEVACFVDGVLSVVDFEFVGLLFDFDCLVVVCDCGGVVTYGLSLFELDVFLVLCLLVLFWFWPLGFIGGFVCVYCCWLNWGRLVGVVLFGFVIGVCLVCFKFGWVWLFGVIILSDCIAVKFGCCFSSCLLMLVCLSVLCCLWLFCCSVWGLVGVCGLWLFWLDVCFLIVVGLDVIWLLRWVNSVVCTYTDVVCFGSCAGFIGFDDCLFWFYVVCVWNWIWCFGWV